MSVARSPAFAVELRPEGKNRHVVVISVGRKEMPPIELEEPDAVWLSLVSLGAPVAWEEVTVTGTVRDDVLERLRNAAKEVGAEPEVLRKQRREGGPGSGDDGKKDEGKKDDGNEQGEGKKDEGKR